MYMNIHAYFTRSDVKSCLLSGQVGLEYRYAIDDILAIYLSSEYCHGSPVMSGFVERPGSGVEVIIVDACRLYLPFHPTSVDAFYEALTFDPIKH
jgi:hypothetical protein